MATAELHSQRDAVCDNCQKLYGQEFGKLLQAILGILMGFSAIQYLRFYTPPLVDDVSLLYVSSAMMLLFIPLANLPKMRIFLGRRLMLWAGLGIAWYLVVSIISYLKFHGGAFTNSPDGSISVFDHALLTLPLTLLVAYFAIDRRNPPASLPTWSMLLLVFGLFGMPYNAQLGQIPLCTLGFVIAFYAGFLVGNPKLLFSVITIAAAGTLAFGLHRYFLLTPHSELWSTRLASNDPWGMHGLIPHNFLAQYLVLIISTSIALLCYMPKWVRPLVKLVIVFMAFCLLLTQSRGAMIGMAAMLVAYLFLTKSGSVKRWQRILLCICAITMFLFVVYITLTVRGEGRIYMIRMGYSQFLRSPIIGNGISSWRFDLNFPYTAIYGDCHNAIVETLCDTGLVGLLVAGVLLYAVITQYKALYNMLRNDKDRRAFTVCTAGVFGYLVTFVFHINFWLQYVTPAVPILLGLWWGITAFQDDRVVVLKTKSFSCQLAVLGLLLISLASAATVASFNLVSKKISLAEYLSYKRFPGILSVKYLDVQEWGTRPVTILDVSPAREVRQCAKNKTK